VNSAVNASGTGDASGAGAIAVVVVRNGELPLGAVEAVLEAAGNVLLLGTGVDHAVVQLTSHHFAKSLRTHTIATDDFGRLAEAVHEDLFEWPVLIFPASPDGRDLAPRVAHLFAMPLFAGAIRVQPQRVTVTRASGQVAEEFVPPPRFIATLIPNTRGIEHPYPEASIDEETTTEHSNDAVLPVVTVGVDPADPATMDLTEATRIVAGGQGLGSTARFDKLNRFASSIGASLGGTRVASDAGWIPFERQIGTTGVIVSPDLYLAFAISGATQHTTGLGDPDHVISVNLDPSCPMMAMADLAIIADANAVIDALNERVALRSPEPPKPGENPR
jgi:electron transfer flavoprotein alpha subunit